MNPKIVTFSRIFMMEQFNILQNTIQNNHKIISRRFHRFSQKSNKSAFICGIPVNLNEHKPKTFVSKSKKTNNQIL